MDKRTLGVALVLSVTQNAAYALLFLSYMNGYLLEELKAGPGLPGYSLALYGAVVFIANPIAGQLLDRFSPRAVFAAALALQLAAAAVLLLVPTIAGFLAATALLAAGAGGAWPTLYAVLARSLPESVRTRASGILAVAGYLATALGFAAGVLLLQAATRTIAFGVLAVTVAVSAPVMYSSRLSRGRGGGPDNPDEQSGAPGHSVPLFGAVVFGYFAVTAALTGAYGPYLIDSQDVSIAEAVPFMLPAGLTALLALLAVTAGHSERTRPRNVAILFGVAAIGAGGVAVANELWVAALAAIPLAAGIGGIGPLVGATMLDIGGTSRRGGLLFGTLMSVEALGAIAGPAVIATVVQFANPRYGMAAIALILGLLVAAVATAPAHGRPTAPVSE
jgi:DHA2 family lincomycin resistance protein-like MFS transporter